MRLDSQVHYQGVGLSTRLFLHARWRWTPYTQMASYLPKEGKILDLGCGHGLLSATLALQSPKRDVLGVDHDQDRIALAQRAMSQLTNLELSVGGFETLLTGPYQGIALIDVMHYFSWKRQEELFSQAFNALTSGGVLIVRDVDQSNGFLFRVNRLHEKLMLKIGFTQAQELHFRKRRDWEDVLRRVGFQVESKPCTRFPFSDVLFICKKN